MIRTGRKNDPAIILNDIEMRMILDSLVEDGYVMGYKRSKHPYDLLYQYNSDKNHFFLNNKHKPCRIFKRLIVASHGH